VLEEHRRRRLCNKQRNPICKGKHKKELAEKDEAAAVAVLVFWERNLLPFKRRTGVGS
jgi:hypothetical protein